MFRISSIWYAYSKRLSCPSIMEHSIVISGVSKLSNGDHVAVTLLNEAYMRKKEQNGQKSTGNKFET